MLYRTLAYAHIMHKFNQQSIQYNQFKFERSELILFLFPQACHNFFWENAISNLNTEAPIVERACLARVSLSPLPIYKTIREI